MKYTLAISFHLELIFDLDPDTVNIIHVRQQYCWEKATFKAVHRVLISTSISEMASPLPRRAEVRKIKQTVASRISHNYTKTTNNVQLR
jgi:hypothetical protein